ncbi:MAG: hypothetical protein PUE85_03055 [Firmicutes bacterium]|nr:hypothetical protein [Bacillota bacterium]
MCIEKMFKKEPEKNKGLEILLKIFLVVGIIAGAAVILKLAYEKYRKSVCCLCGDDCCCCDDDDCCDDLLDECECCCEDDGDDDCCCCGDENKPEDNE